jgi:hypothetical protein
VGCERPLFPKIWPRAIYLETRRSEHWRLEIQTRSVLYATASLPVTDLKELIAWLRANPNKASAGVTTVSYRMVTALFQKESSRLVDGVMTPDHPADRSSEIRFVGMRKVDRSARMVEGAFSADEFRPSAQRAPISYLLYPPL